jgi:DNA-directed RNA polymerase specialized sigma subunit
LNTYNPQQGTLKTHLLSQLQSLRRASAQEQQIISIPEQVGLDYQHLVDAENELRDQLGRDPADSEIADRTGLSYKRLAHIRRSQGSVSEGSVLASNDGMGMPATQIPGRDQEAEAWVGFVYADLGPVDRVIMDYSLGRNGTPKLGATEIAKRLGITPGAVSQRAAKIQQLLDARHELGVL